MISAKTFQKYADDPAAFREDLVVDVSGVARRFGTVQEDWQIDTALDQALLVCSGRKKKEDLPNVRMRHYAEFPRGHNKTTGLAMACSYALAFATRPISGYAFAVDRDQAALLKDAMLTLIRLNPWLADILEVQANLVRNVAKGHPGEGADLTVSTSDVASSFGILPSIIMADEFTVWEGDGSLWHSLISSAAKREDCLLCVATNAGFMDSWQAKVVDVIRTDPAWIYRRLEGVQASWMKPQLEEMRRMLPAVAFARLFENIWSTGGGDCLTPDQVAAAFHADLHPMTGAEPGWLFCAGIDLGLTRDFSAVVVLAVPDNGRSGIVRLAHHKVWKPLRNQKIDLTEIETYILELDERFNLQRVGFDPWQAELLAQRLEAASDHRSRSGYLAPNRRRQSNMPWMQNLAPTSSMLRDQATMVIEIFTDCRLACYPCEPLRQDLLKLRVEEKSYGIRLTSPRDEISGHGDVFSAFANALMITRDLAGKKPIIVGSSTEGGPGDSPLKRALEDAAYRARELEKEQEQWRNHEGEGYTDGLREAMRDIGRIN